MLPSLKQIDPAILLITAINGDMVFDLDKNNYRLNVI